MMLQHFLQEIHAELEMARRKRGTGRVAKLDRAPSGFDRIFQAG